MLTKPITHAAWLRETTVAGTFSGEKTRSAHLLAIDQALAAYEAAGAAIKVARLHALFDAYETWYDSKKKKADGSVKSIRSGGDQMAVFESWLQDEQTRLLLAEEAGWHNGPNCYAYAMKCRAPVGNAMTPGAAAGNVASLRGIEGNMLAYSHLLLERIRDDAHADGGKVVTLLPAGVLAAGQLPTPAPMPNVIPQNQYLVAMLVNNAGFHFMRRDTASGLWCHKNGSYGAPEYGVQLIGAIGRLGARKLPITDAVALDYLANGAAGRHEMLGGGYFFAGYILVPDTGFVVRGA